VSQPLSISKRPWEIYPQRKPGAAAAAQRDPATPSVRQAAAPRCFTAVQRLARDSVQFIGANSNEGAEALACPPRCGAISGTADETSSGMCLAQPRSVVRAGG